MTQKIIRENAFELKKKKPGLNLTPGLSANRPSNNWAQGSNFSIRTQEGDIETVVLNFFRLSLFSSV